MSGLFTWQGSNVSHMVEWVKTGLIRLCFALVISPDHAIVDVACTPF